jgi:hypothetical protein
LTIEYLLSQRRSAFASNHIIIITAARRHAVRQARHRLHHPHPALAQAVALQKITDNK